MNVSTCYFVEMESILMKDDAKDIYTNRAKLPHNSGVATDCTDFECCPEELVFAMQDTKHAFSLGLTTVLECLDIAEREGYVPPLPDDWWNLVRQG